MTLSEDNDMNRLRSTLAAATLTLALAPLAQAHEGHHHNAMGTVKAATADRLELETQAGKLETFTLTAETAFKRGDAAAKREDLKSGERAVVMYETKDGRNLAIEVKLPAAEVDEHAGHEHHAAKPAVATPATPSTPEAAVDAFFAALKAGNRQAALALLAPEVVIFEQGGAEMSRDEYAGHHLEGDMKYLAAIETRVLDRRTGGDAEHAWVLTRSETSGTVEGKAVSSRGVETMVLEKRSDGWKVVHIHWSSGKKA